MLDHCDFSFNQTEHFNTRFLLLRDIIFPLDSINALISESDESR